MPAAVAQPSLGALALADTEGFVHLRLQELLHGNLHDATDEVRGFANYGFAFLACGLTLLLGHGCFGFGLLGRSRPCHDPLPFC
jgi:hypothetical protein